MTNTISLVGYIRCKHPHSGGDLNPDVTVTCPHPIRKPTATVIFITTTLAIAPRVKALVSCPWIRQSKNLLEKVELRFCMLQNLKTRSCTKNQVSLLVSVKFPMDVRTSFYYLAILNTLSELGGKTIIWEVFVVMALRVRIRGFFCHTPLRI